MTKRTNVFWLVLAALLLWTQYVATGQKETLEEHLRPGEQISSVQLPDELLKPSGCAQYGLKITLTHPGCIARPVTTFACKGLCHSRSIPEWDPQLERIHMVQDCKCCKPLERRYRLVPLQCPGKPQPKMKLVLAATYCMCRPCSHGEVEAEQPYDY